MNCEITVDSAYMRGVINGTITFRKCPNCDSDGVEIQSYDDNGEPCKSADENATRYACDKCNGIGFIEIPS